jgi:Heliorhodopsin
MIERQLNIENIFHGKTSNRHVILRATTGKLRIPSLEDPYEHIDESDPRKKIYLGYFSLAELSFFTSTVHFTLMVGVILASFSLNKDIKPNKITQCINVWVPELANQQIMFPESRELGPNISLAEKCKPYIPKTIPYKEQLATIFPKILLVGEIDNRISIALFFFLSFAFQFFKSVNVKKFQDHPGRHELWLGDTFYDNLAKGRVSKTHFVEYSLSATLMILVMITQIGITDLPLIISICVNTWACMIIGLLAEYIVDAEESPELCDQKLYDYNLSFLTHLLGWVPLLSVIFTMVAPISTYKSCIVGKVEIPDFVFVFVVGEIVLFCSFGLVQLFSIDNVCKIRNTTKCQIQQLKEKIDKGMQYRLHAKRQSTIRYNPITNYIETKHKNQDDSDSDMIKEAAENDFIKKCTTLNETKKKEIVDNACTAEARYLCLSLVAKTFLALTIYIGINTQPG